MTALHYLYKIYPPTKIPFYEFRRSDPIRTLPDVLPLTSLDAADGFIHLSTASQVPGTLRRFFNDYPEIYVFKVRYRVVKNQVQWEDPSRKIQGEECGDGLFPHLYNGGQLGHKEIEAIGHWYQENNSWDEALADNDTWLEH